MKRDEIEKMLQAFKEKGGEVHQCKFRERTTNPLEKHDFKKSLNFKKAKATNPGEPYEHGIIEIEDDLSDEIPTIEAD